MKAMNGSSNALAPTPEHVESYYAATVAEPVAAEAVEGTLKCDVCVVGAGYTGLSAALHLARRGVSVVVLEQALLGWGASGRNGGQIHVGMRRNQQWIESHLGRENALAQWQLALRARDHLDWLVNTHAIRCDLRNGLLHADHRQRYVRDSHRYAEYLHRHYGYTSLRMVGAEEIRHLVATRGYFGGTLDERGGHLHPLNFALGIARAARECGARLHEQSEVTDLTRTASGWAVSTAKATVNAQSVLLAGNGYLRGLSAQVATHVMPINNFIAVTEPLGEGEALELIRNGYAVSDSRFVVYYFRITADHRLLFGGGENYTYRFPDHIGEYVRKHIVRVFPQLAAVRIDYGWGGTLAITPNRMPYVRELLPGLFNASGFSGKGVVLAPYVGKIMADAISGERDEFDLLNRMPVPRFPGGPALRTPTLIAAMSLAALRDRL
jgi:gamma-glutamylputrescine oxidase